MKSEAELYYNAVTNFFKSDDFDLTSDHKNLITNYNTEMAKLKNAKSAIKYGALLYFAAIVEEYRPAGTLNPNRDLAADFRDKTQLTDDRVFFGFLKEILGLFPDLNMSSELVTRINSVSS